MAVLTSVSPKRTTRVLFLAWGFSIHAKRRIQPFVDDPSFEVAVASTHRYNFQGAKNVLLADAHWEEGRRDSLQKGTKRVGERRSTSWGWGLRKSSDRTNTLFGGNRIWIKSGGFSGTEAWRRNHRILNLFSALRQVCSDILKGIKDFRTLKLAVREFNPDLIFLQTLLYPCYLAYFLPRSIPKIITFWNGDVVWWAKSNGIDRMLKRQIVLHGAKTAKAVTVNSRRAFDACMGYGTKKEKIHVIRYPGVDLIRFKPLAKNASRKELGITSRKVVLCPRGMGGYLNSDIIVESSVRVVKECPGILFLFVSGVGGEREWEKHQKLAQKLGTEKNFRWDGQVPWDAMPTYYSSSDVMVSISSYDSLPNCMLEAMACGVPVIMGDIPQIREWVVDRVNGFLTVPRDPVGLADCILKVLLDSDGMIGSFVARNIELVRREADHEKGVKSIKDLAHQVAWCHRQRGFVQRPSQVG